MPLKTIYISVIWVPGRLAFANKTRRIFDTNVQSETDLAEDLMQQKAQALKQKTMTKDSVASIMSDMYYEIYDNPEDRRPRISSR